jgi:DNA-binding transcriptional LysR family regulator
MHVAYRHASQVYGDVLSNVVDLGLVAYPSRDPQLKIVPLRNEPLVLICHPNHPFAKAASIKLSDLQGQKFVHFEAEIPTRRAIDRCLKDAHVTVQTMMEFDNIETVKRAVEVEAGIAIVPQPTITQEVSKKTLAEVKLEGNALFRPLAAIYKKSKILSPALKQLLTVLKG